MFIAFCFNKLRAPAERNVPYMPLLTERKSLTDEEL